MYLAIWQGQKLQFSADRIVKQANKEHNSTVKANFI